MFANLDKIAMVIGLATDLYSGHMALEGKTTLSPALVVHSWRNDYGSSLFPVGRGGLDGWRMMAIDDTGTDLWTVAWAWEELEGSGVAV